MKHFFVIVSMLLSVLAFSQPQPSTELLYDQATGQWYEVTVTTRLLGDTATYRQYLQVQYDQLNLELVALISAIEAKKAEIRRTQKAIEEAATQVGVDVVGEIDDAKWLGTWKGTVRGADYENIRIRRNAKGDVQISGINDKPIEMLLKDNTTAVMVDYPVDGSATILYRKGREILSEDGAISLAKGSDR